ncbi:MAG: hypothetical protein CVV24_03065 [Ignavibacteriae bacterium HGW-Ignavibacteriae-3]|nr:MAG: hypothetical protein CVV24_03065 [Ignavibacteriae bacterium HGW-Ignavibacteriae-3]
MKSIKIALLGFSLITLILLEGCGKNNKDELKESSFMIYLVALEGSNLQGKNIGCNDILVPVSKLSLVEKNVVETSMRELFSAKSTEELTNFIKGPGLFFYQATLSNGIAEIYIKGDFAISSKCDIYRIREQLYETARQFSEVNNVKFFMNAQSLESYLSLAEKGFK